MLNLTQVSMVNVTNVDVAQFNLRFVVTIWVVLSLISCYFVLKYLTLLNIVSCVNGNNFPIILFFERVSKVTKNLVTL